MAVLTAMRNRGVRVLPACDGLKDFLKVGKRLTCADLVVAVADARR
jgi:hypothetical protein